MTEPVVPPVAKPRWLDWMPAISAAGLVVSCLIAIGGFKNEQSQQGLRIDRVEARIEQLTDIKERMARIETKLDILIPQRRVEDREHAGAQP